MGDKNTPDNSGIENPELSEESKRLLKGLSKDEKERFRRKCLEFLEWLDDEPNDQAIEKQVEDPDFEMKLLRIIASTSEKNDKILELEKLKQLYPHYDERITDTLENVRKILPN